MQLLPDQVETDAKIHASRAAGNKNTLVVCPTGSGKTVMMGNGVAKAGCGTLSIAHRQELVSQISTTLARFGVKHKIIAPPSVVTLCRDAHKFKLGYHMIDPDAGHGVASVDTLIRRIELHRPFLNRVGLWNVDEAHHLLRDNKWGKAVGLMPDAYGLGWSASPHRADGNGLGADNDGVFHDLVRGRDMRDLIDMGRLTDYRFVCTPTTLADAELKVGATGDYTQASLSKQLAGSSTIVGDVVATYLKFAYGKRGVTFVPGIDIAKIVVRAFRDAGVPAEVVSDKTPASLRAKFVKMLERGELLQLVNVDLFGEGFDLPAIEVISMLRKTQSLAIYIQQCGRPLRTLEGKTHGIIIDHVGNFAIHGPPDKPRHWSLERPKERATPLDPDAIPSTTCENPECFYPYPAFLKSCPRCGSVKVPLDRGSPETVVGELVEMSPELLQQIREDIARVDMSPIDIAAASASMPIGAQHGRIDNHIKRQTAQNELRSAIAWFGGVHKHNGLSEGEAQRMFFLKHGIDAYSARALNTGPARNLTADIMKELSR
ncbi:MAG: DEAD/DEAH box helicase family protein [Rhodobacteraceae bacterium]|nr:DEAD/DEAH box helicase family protein [Paracoccaceae bacterium]